MFASFGAAQTNSWPLLFCQKKYMRTFLLYNTQCINTLEKAVYYIKNIEEFSQYSYWNWNDL